MSMLENVYQAYIEKTQEELGSKEFREQDSKLDEYIDSLNLDFDRLNELQKLITATVIAMEKQSFMAGFKYATNLWKECN